MPPEVRLRRTHVAPRPSACGPPATPQVARASPVLSRRESGEAGLQVASAWVSTSSTDVSATHAPPFKAGLKKGVWVLANARGQPFEPGISVYPGPASHARGSVRGSLRGGVRERDLAHGVGR